MRDPNPPPVLAAASLELKAEKESAHDCSVLSVAFSSKGNTIVSASGDIYGQGGTNTLKVWVSAALPAEPDAGEGVTTVLVRMP